jgi:hypothetical protein
MSPNETPIPNPTIGSPGDSQTEDAASKKKSDVIDSVSKTIQVLSVVVGVVISVFSFNDARRHEAVARKTEAEKSQAEAAKPFIELRQKLYLEAVQAAAILANPDDHTKEETTKARKRFRELYVAELSLVEARSVEQHMRDLARVIEPKLIPMSEAQREVYDLAHALRDSLAKSWHLEEALVDNPLGVSGDGSRR